MFFFSDNLGDNLNNILLRKMTYRKIQFYDTQKKIDIKSDYDRDIQKLNEVAKTDLIFIGSILEIISNTTYNFQINRKKNKNFLNKCYYKLYDFFHPLIIFGAGFISQNLKNELYLRNIKVIAVRGNITLKRLINNGVKIKNSVVLADPGLLFPFIFNLANFNNTKKYELCVIPHYVDINNILISAKIKVNKYNILNITESPYKFIISLLECKRVLSSSLHGLIISDSLGIPNMRFVVSDNIGGGDYKFEDYYSSYNLSLPLKIDLRKTFFTENQLNEIKSNYKITRYMVREKQCQLLIHFPYGLNKEFKKFKNLCNKSI